MSKVLDALEKINHTICLNLNEKRLKFNLDKYESCDCENLKEFVDCYCLIEQALKILEGIEESLKYGYVFIGYDKDNEPVFQFADTKLYEEIKKNKAHLER